MALSEIDRGLLDRCLAKEPRAWEDFVDRFLGLVIHVINHTAQARSLRLSQQDVEDLSAEVFLTIISDDFALLRRFRAESSLATYLTVIARRIVVKDLLRRKGASSLSDVADDMGVTPDLSPPAEDRIDNREEVERMLEHLQGAEAEVIRMYHLEGKSYREISSNVGMPENTIGPTLSRARAKLRKVSLDS